jgi:DNA-binding response OmpR family regulator
MTNKGTILAVDDAHSILKLLTDILTATGYEVRSADSGALALPSIAASPPDLILLDIRMPGMDGFEVLRFIKAREESRDIPIIMLSGVSEMEQRVKCLKLGAVDYISKPFEPEELFARVQTHMELRRMRLLLEDRAAALRLANEQLQREIAERKKAEEAERWKANALQEALNKIKILSGLLPVCSHCKKIRDEKGCWSQLEDYITEHTDTEFSHGICDDCLNKQYPEQAKRMREEGHEKKVTREADT